MNWSQRGIFLVTLAHSILIESCLAAVSNNVSGDVQDDPADSLKAQSDPLKWWQTSAIYQIYPRSFKDSNGDGVGDLNGIAEKADYLKSLGIGAIWLSPIYQSPMADFGYDISDYRAIDPLFGTIDDFKRLIEALHSRGIKLLMDLVPNHTSEEHEWFKKSVQKIEPYRDYYVWRDAKTDENGTRVPPNNWISVFGGPAWTWNEARQQYYFHSFIVKQPDLNYTNPAVLEEMKNVIRFWLTQGVDGFRVDAVTNLMEDPQFRDEPRSYKEGVGPDESEYLQHIYTANQPGSFEVVHEFRTLIDEHDSLMMVKTFGSPNLTVSWYGNKTMPCANFPLNTLFMSDADSSSTARDFETVIESWYEALPEGEWSNWMIGNHDTTPRPAKKFGRDMLDSLHIMQAMMPATMITYNGDEIGMVDGDLRWSETVDPVALNAGKSRYMSVSRDPVKTPFQWDSSVSAGFSSNRITWLPCAPDYWRHNVEQQMKGKSHLSVYKSLVALKSLPVIQTGSMLIVAPTEEILVISRFLQPMTMFVALINTGSFEETFDLEGSSQSLVPPNKTWLVYASSTNCKHGEGEIVNISRIELRPKAGVVLMNVDATQSVALHLPNDDSAKVKPDEISKGQNVAQRVELPEGAWIVAPGQIPSAMADITQPVDISKGGLDVTQLDKAPSGGTLVVQQSSWTLLICLVPLLFCFVPN